MEENVALDSKKQKKFVKSIRGIKKLIKKNEKVKASVEPKKNYNEAKKEKPFSMRLKDGKIKKKRKDRGLVYLSHIPHGFYEHQMTQYFKQFGVVTNARVIRSKRTGHSKGFAFVEFKEPSVAQIVAETMNNYLMGKRLIKAVYIEPEKQKRRAFRKHWNAVQNPTSVRRQKLKKEFNAEKDDAQELKKAKKQLSKLNITRKRLSALGINYDFFTPVDVPEALLDKLVKKEKDEDVKQENNKKPTKGKKEKENGEDIKQENNKKATKGKKEKENGEDIKQENNKKATKGKKEKESSEDIKQENNKKPKKENKTVDNEINKKNQKEKEQKLKNAGVKPAEEFISMGSDDSDDSCKFDSDEYEKFIGDDEDFSSTDEEEQDGQNDSETESDEEEVVVPNKKPKTKWNQRKAPQKPPLAAKKPVKKQFKKK